jgi:PAS domain S-box-containing protein
MTMFKKKFEKSLRFKFLSVLSLFLFMGTVVLSTVVALNEEKTFEHSLTTKGMSFASYIAKLSQDPLIMKDGIQLDSLVSEANKDEDISYTVIRDARGNLITSQYASINYTMPRFKTILSGLSKDSELPDMIAAIKQKEAILELSVPIRTGADTIGMVTIGMSEYRLHQQITGTILFVIALNLVVAVVLGAVFFITSKRLILDPITELGHAADRIAKGDLSTHVKIDATGEIRTLVDNFNQMAVNLAKTTVSRNYMDEIISSMSDVLIVVSPDRTITRVNTATTALLGYHEPELVGRPLDLIIPVEASAEKDPLSLVLEQGYSSVNSIEKVCLTRQGKKIPILFSAALMRGLNGGIQGVVCVAQDITDRKKAEEELKKSSREIKEMYEELRTFSYITSHDLRAPLVNIKGFAKELLRGIGEIGPVLAKNLEYVEEEQRQKFRQVLEKDIPEALKFIDESAGRMDMLMNAILKLSRADRRKIVPEVVNTEDLVRKILNTLSPQIASRGISVTVGKLPDLVTDRTSVELIIGNLLDNAVKYLDPGRAGDIAITAEPSDGQTIFHIHDNGRGMATEDIPRAFESFRRVGKQDVPGEGMGLAYVKTNVRMLGGRVWCESVPGRGTTFSVSLPVRTERRAILPDGVQSHGDKTV